MQQQPPLTQQQPTPQQQTSIQQSQTKQTLQQQPQDILSTQSSIDRTPTPSSTLTNSNFNNTLSDANAFLGNPSTDNTDLIPDDDKLNDILENPNEPFDLINPNEQFDLIQMLNV